MTHEPVYFIVTQRQGREEAALYHGWLPGVLKKKIARAPFRFGGAWLVYVLRLDTLPDAERWLGMPIDDLYAVFAALRAQGKLPTASIQ